MKGSILGVKTAWIAIGTVITGLFTLSDGWNRLYSLVDGQLTAYRGPGIDLWGPTDALQRFLDRNNGKAVSFNARQVELRGHPPFIAFITPRISMDYSGSMSDLVMQACSSNRREKVQKAFLANQSAYTFGLLSGYGGALDAGQLLAIQKRIKTKTPASQNQLQQLGLRCENTLTLEGTDSSLFDWKGLGQSFGAPITGKFKVTTNVSGGPTYHYRLKQISE